MGGIVGFHDSCRIEGCKSSGTFKSTVAVPTGGLVGIQTNAAISTGAGCSVDCTISSGKGASGMIVGKYTGTSAITFGNQSQPITVSGSLDGTTITADNLNQNLIGATAGTVPTFWATVK